MFQRVVWTVISVAWMLGAQIPVTADCPDGYWDCVSQVPGNLQLTPTGGFLYGRCFKHLRCGPCNPRDEADPVYVLQKCNQLVPECKSECVYYSDLTVCCNMGERCGNLNGGMRDAACAVPLAGVL